MPNQWWHGPRVLGTPPENGDWGAIGSWAWALSRALDYLQTNPRVDAKHIAVFGLGGELTFVCKVESKKNFYSMFKIKKSWV